MTRIILLLTIAVSAAGCATHRKLERLRNTEMTAQISPASEQEVPELNVEKARRDTLKVSGPDGRPILLMRAVRDEDGEMVATEVLDAAIVSARFRNVAERNGKVNLCFDVTVPSSMRDSKWQLRFYPEMVLMADTVDLDPVIITGEQYRREQLRGYQQYNRFLASIVADSAKFIDTAQLEVFLRRNLPGIYRFRNDTSFVSSEEFSSAFGVTEKEAINHYTSRMAISRNRRKISRKNEMFRKYVKVPIETERLRLDTVLQNSEKEFVYMYSQSISAAPGLRKAHITLAGEIFEQDKRVYRIPQSLPLTFYISSLSSLADEAEKYKTQVIERTVNEKTYCLIRFEPDRSDIKPDLSGNASEIQRINGYLEMLAEHKVYDLDSIVVSAFCSPEGSCGDNMKLSGRRSKAVAEYFGQSLASAKGNTGKSLFISKSLGENWDMLAKLVRADSVIAGYKSSPLNAILDIQGLDQREKRLQKEPYYAYMKENIYPKLRVVKFDFHLHRKGMTKDTIHTTAIDSVYMQGVKAIKDRDYKKAVRLLGPYADYNSAVAYCAVGMNATAMDILKKSGGGRSDRAEYLKAILFSRLGDERQAVECYLRACSGNRMYISRGNLDPEISSLIEKYSLNRE